MRPFGAIQRDNWRVFFAFKDACGVKLLDEALDLFWVYRRKQAKMMNTASVSRTIVSLYTLMESFVMQTSFLSVGDEIGP